LKRLTDEQVNELILKIKSGDKTDIPLLIENYTGFVLSLAHRYANHRSSTVDDCKSAGFFGLCKAIENIDNFLDGNFLAFIGRYIVGEIQEEIAGTLFGPTAACNRKRKQRGKEQTRPKRTSIGRDGEPIRQFSVNDFDVGLTEKSAFRSIRQERSKYKNNSEIDEFYIGEMINDITQTNEERQIIEYRLQGFTDREIATKLGCSHTKVYLIRKTISERYENEYGRMV